jgi:uncharacterized membrane protein
MNDTDRRDETPPMPPPAQGASFDFNRPTIVALLYLVSPLVGITAIVGVVLAYVWRGEPHPDWEDSHYLYLIRTFWIGLLGSAICVVLMLVLIGFPLLAALAVLIIVRCVLALVNAQKRQPMPSPTTLLA